MPFLLAAIESPPFPPGPAGHDHRLLTAANRRPDVDRGQPVEPKLHEIRHRLHAAPLGDKARFFLVGLRPGTAYEVGATFRPAIQIDPILPVSIHFVLTYPDGRQRVADGVGDSLGSFAGPAAWYDGSTATVYEISVANTDAILQHRRPVRGHRHHELRVERRGLRPLVRRLQHAPRSADRFVHLDDHRHRLVTPKRDLVFDLESRCGNLLEIDLIDIGFDILNPVQVSAKGMDTKELKAQYGRDIVFWGGGVDTQRILPFGKPQEVAEEVKRRIDDLAPGGGFVFAAVHNVQALVPPENIVAAFDTALEYGRYGC